MWRFKFQIICTFVLYGIILVNHTKTQKNKANVILYFRRVTCRNNSCCDDFQRFPGGVVCGENSDRYAKYMSIFEFPDIKHLPARVFQEKHIGDIVIKDPDVTVDNNFLEGISYLDKLNVERSSIKNIPDFRFIKDSIREIRIEKSLLTSLEGENLQNLTVVTHLSFIENAIRFIDPNFFKGTVNVIDLDLSHNLLTSIARNVLDPLKKLGFFRANYNNLMHFSKHFSVTQPVTLIMLRNNNITDISSVLGFSFEENVEKNYVMPYECYAGFTRHRHSIRSFFTIHELDLSNNLIKETPESIFPCLSLVYYYTVPGFVLQIDILKLNDNNLKELNFLLRYLMVNRLYAAANQIEYLTNLDFKYTIGIMTVELWQNKIKRIDTETFSYLRTDLLLLDLGSNSITHLNGSIKYLIKLRILILRHNSIELFEEDEFSGLEELLFLSLEYNHIKSIDQLQKLPRLRYVNIKHNDIESIRPDLLPSIIEGMHLADNPIKCNCLLHLFMRRLNTSTIETDIKVCSKPDFGASIQKKSNSQDICSYGCANDENALFMFVDCSSRNLSFVPQIIGNNFTEVGITSGLWFPVIRALDKYMPLIPDYPHVFNRIAPNMDDWDTVNSYDYNGNFVYEDPFDIIYSTIHIEDKVLGVSLENNGLESLDTAQLPPNLIWLYLSNNKLRRLPESFLENQRNLKQLTLSGNPWKCDCDTLKFKKWLTSEKEKIKDIDNVRCGIIGKETSHLNGRAIWSLTDLDLCQTDNDQTIIISVSGALTFVIFCLVAKVLYATYKLNIKLFLYSRGITFVREEDLDYDKTFDAFISFSHSDDEFVINEIISVIEKRNPNIHLCFHIRDFLPGELIITNITRAVQNSKRTVLILSKNFLESEWCIAETRAAHSQAMEDKVHRIIVIKVGDLPKEMDPLVKAYLVSTTYITWGESNFWNKLLYVLPSHVTCRGTVSDNMENNETVF